MRYFTYDLIAAANNWVKQTPAQQRQAAAEFAAAVEKYQRELDSMKSRISRDAWQFFRYGYDEEGIHDARLLSLKVGDGLNYVADGSEPFRVNHQRVSVRIEFLNYEQTRHYSFDLRKVKRLKCDLFGEEPFNTHRIGDLYICELTMAGADLQLGLQFANGATIVAQFEKLVFRKKRLKRRYDIAEIF